MTRSRGSSFSEMNVEVSEGSHKGFFANASSQKIFLIITAGLAVLAIIALVIALPVYYSGIEDPKPTKNPATTIGVIPLDTTTPEETTTPTVTVGENETFDCYPENNTATEEMCLDRGCLWIVTNASSPNCVYQNVRMYQLSGDIVDEPEGMSSQLVRSEYGASQNHFGEQFNTLNIQTTYISPTTLRIKIFPDETRYEVPMDHPASTNLQDNALYTAMHTDDGGVVVLRNSTSTVLFNTSIGQIMFADQFLQISTSVASEYVYGFGEHMHLSFKHDMNWKTFGMFTRGQIVGADDNLYGVHPYFTCMEGDGNAYGVYFANSNAMEVTLQPNPAVTYRSIGGLMNFYIFLGPTPEDVTSQYTELIGRPYFPPYWSLGFQLSKWDYGSLDELRTVVERNVRKIPYEVQYSDIDYMERQLDFTIDQVAYNGLEEFVRDLKVNYSMKYIIILDPAISGNETAGTYLPYERGIEDGVFITTQDGDIAWGKVWPEYPNITVDDTKPLDYQVENYRAFVAFPDFSLPATEQWWINFTVDFHKKIEFDGLWIDMNEPSSKVDGSPNGCPANNNLEHPPYVPKLVTANLYDQTLCMSSRQFNPATGSMDNHYNLHSLYGKSHSLPTLYACRNSTGERCILISRSTFPGSGKYTGHWLGDNESSWEHLRTSIIGMLEFNLFGIPYVGADVCGFFDDTTEQLCLRWMQLGAFYPFYRNHNAKGQIDQDPGAFGEKFLEDSKKILDTRHTLLPYLYTLFYEAHTAGATVVRPMMHQFPGDINTYEIERQLLWGPALLVTPVLEENSTSVVGYFPAGRWFDYFSGVGLVSPDQGTSVTLETPLDQINVHVYGGYIIPTQEPDFTTFESRQNPFGLIVALDSNGQSSGNLFWDDGTSIDTIANMEYNLIHFEYENNQLTISPITVGMPGTSMILGNIRVLGLTEVITEVSVDGLDHGNFNQNNITFELNIVGVTKDMTSSILISWNGTKVFRRVDCYPESSSGIASDCEARGCTYVGNMNPLGSWCIYEGPSVYNPTAGRNARDTSGITTALQATENVLDHFGENIARLVVETSYISPTTLRVKIRPENTSTERFEVPMEHPTTIEKPSDALYNVEHSVDGDGRFGVKVERASKSRILFDTSIGELMFADQFLQISTRVASDYVYGFGEHMHLTFKHDMSWKSFGMFSRDQGVGADVNLYGVHPYFMCMEGDGDAYGVYFVNSNAMDVTLEPMPAITYRSLGGILDFYIFMGPTPEQVTSQYTEIIGRPYFPPYWSLGFQLSRYGYENLENLTRVFDRNVGKIPYEVQYSDIDYMERQRDFTIDPVAYDGLEDFVRMVKNDHNMKYIIILDPAISGNETSGTYPAFDQGVRDDVFIKTPEGNIAWGKVWPDYPNVTVDDTQDWEYQTENYRSYAAFPDFGLPVTEEWWTNLTVDFHKRIEFDGLWIDMNEPASFVHGSPDGCPASSILDNPPYVPNLASGNIYDKTLCMQSVQYNPANGGTTPHYNMHSLYGKSQSLPSLNACRKSTGERCIVISRSTYPGSGKYVGHWLGDNTSIWQHLATSIIGMMEFNLFGIPYIGADVCGFFEDTTEELCMRWMQVGAFYPFDRNHNSIDRIDQDPAYFGEEFLQNTKKILDIRYTLLPYLYTLFYQSHMTGATVVRPMMNQFPNDMTAYAIDKQFMWGPALLVTAVLDEGKTTVEGYFPNGVWYDYYDGKELMVNRAWTTLDTPIDHINIHIYGGNIMPTQEPALTTFDSRKNPFGLIVALDSDGHASGSIFWDDGTSIGTIDDMEYTYAEFSCSDNTLTNVVNHTNLPTGNLTLSTIRVLGVQAVATRVLIDGMIHSDFSHNEDTLELFIQNIENVSLNKLFEIKWELNDVWKRVDCMPSMSTVPSEAECLDRNCAWDISSPVQCSYPSDVGWPSYDAAPVGSATGTYNLTRDISVKQRYGIPEDTLTLEIEHQTNQRLHFKIKDAASMSFEVPEEMNNFPKDVLSDETSALYSVEVTNSPFGIVVKRKQTGKILFDSSVGPLVYEDKYREISTSLPSALVFGLGEHNHQRYRHNLNWKRWAIFTRDVAPIDEWNFYGHQTFYMAVDDVDAGTAVGVYFHNANAMDVTLSPDPMLTYRTTGGVLDFYIFVGNTQEEVVQQYHALIGTPIMPPYWGLGFQLSRWGYQSLDEIKGIYQEMRDAQIPYDIQYGDIDYMEEYKAFTYDNQSFAELPEFVDELHDAGMKFVIILDPGIKIEKGYKAYDEGIEKDIFIKTPDGEPLVTEVWPGETHHPDYTHPNVTEWWHDQCLDFYQNQNVQYDALWIDMNEPANFQPDNADKLKNMNCSDEYNRIPFMPNILGSWIGLHDKSICMENVQYQGLHYNFHSLYGHTMTLSTYDTLEMIMPDKRSFVITRSSFAGTGKYAGHWLGDNQSQWRQLPWPIPTMFEFNLFGFAWIGADVCGFYFNTTEELCMRWMQVGAFYPFSRNHNAADMIPQHPTVFGEAFTNVSREILQIRYDILPYMYTAHYQANAFGGTVVRALVHEFPSDRNAWDADGQFLLGSGFLITPVLEEGATSVTGYFPGAARWYDYRTGKELNPSGRFVQLDAPLEYINLHVRGGTIIPKQRHAVTTTLARQNPMSLLIALNRFGEATGSLYWDDGDERNVSENYLFVDFYCKEGLLNTSVSHAISGTLDVSSLQFESVVIYGVENNVSRVEMDGSEVDTFSFTDSILTIDSLAMSISSNHTLSWFYSVYTLADTKGYGDSNS